MLGLSHTTLHHTHYPTPHTHTHTLPYTTHTHTHTTLHHTHTHTHYPTPHTHTHTLPYTTHTHTHTTLHHTHTHTHTHTHYTTLHTCRCTSTYVILATSRSVQMKAEPLHLLHLFQRKKPTPHTIAILKLKYGFTSWRLTGIILSESTVVSLLEIVGLTGIVLLFAEYHQFSSVGFHLIYLLL